jgi:hypothetical protein
MKRSEMVELIAKRLCPIGIGYPTCEEILDILEKAGMKPPTITVNRPVSLWDSTLCEEVEGFSKVIENEWEPEE